MMIKLLPDQIAANWEFLKTCVVEHAAVELAARENRANSLLNALLMGEAQCWIDYAQPDGDKRVTIRFVVITTVTRNPILNVKNLVMYSLVGFGEMATKREWLQNLRTLVQFGRKLGCDQLLVYAENEQLINIGKSIGANTDTRLLSFNIKEDAK
jgi:hypothetical protein